MHAIVPSQTGALLNCFIKVPNMLHGAQASGHTVISELIPAKVKGEVHFLFLHCSLRCLFEGDIFLIVKLQIISYF